MNAAVSENLKVLLESVLAHATTDSPTGRNRRILRNLLKPIVTDATIVSPRRINYIFPSPLSIGNTSSSQWGMPPQRGWMPGRNPPERQIRTIEGGRTGTICFEKNGHPPLLPLVIFRNCDAEKCVEKHFVPMRPPPPHPDFSCKNLHFLDGGDAHSTFFCIGGSHGYNVHTTIRHPPSARGNDDGISYWFKKETGATR